MATSIADLINAVEHHARSNQTPQHPHDAVAALDRIATLLTRLNDHGIGARTAPSRADTTRRLADACATAAITFEPFPGRLTDLIAITSDAIGRLRDELTDDDRWSITTALASTARSAARTIHASGPYDDVPQLLGLRDRCAELIHTAAQHPPTPTAMTGYDRPIPMHGLPAGLTPAHIVAESTAELIGEFHRRSRERMSIQELLAVCNAAGQLATAAERLPGNTTPRRAGTATRAWGAARESVGLLAQGSREQDGRNDRVLLCAARVEVSLRTLNRLDRLEPEAVHDLSYATAQLPRLADRTAHELNRISATLIIAPGPRPLSEERVSEWLMKQAFAPVRAEITPTIHALRRAAATSTQVVAAPSSELHIAAARPSL